jgi:hypothetical protein
LLKTLGAASAYLSDPGGGALSQFREEALRDRLPTSLSYVGNHLNGKGHLRRSAQILGHAFGVT